MVPVHRCLSAGCPQGTVLTHGGCPDLAGRVLAAATSHLPEVHQSRGSEVGRALAPGMLPGTMGFTSTNVAGNICLSAEPHSQKRAPEVRQACVLLAQHLANLLLGTRGSGESSILEKVLPNTHP